MYCGSSSSLAFNERQSKRRILTTMCQIASMTSILDFPRGDIDSHVPQGSPGDIYRPGIPLPVARAVEASFRDANLPGMSMKSTFPAQVMGWSNQHKS